MNIYCEKISELIGLSGNEIAKRMKEFYRDNSEAEVNSWRNSLPQLIRVVYSAGLKNLYLAIEYELPAGGRIDATLLGDDEEGNHHALVVELKQWSRSGVEYYGKHGFPVIKVNATRPYLSRHPVNQTKEYVDALKSNHSNVVNSQLTIHGCQYLHEEEHNFVNYLKSLFSPKANNEIARDLFIEGDYVTTELDMEIINKITESPDNIPLWHDQAKIMDYIMPLLKEQADGTLKTKHMILISGAAGTGKTIVGFRILAEYWKLHLNANNTYKCKYTLPYSRTINQVLIGLSDNASGIRPVYLNKIRGQQDLLVIDEAHRITEFHNAIKSAQIVIVLQDDKQQVRGNEIGTKANFKRYAERNDYRYSPFLLDYQKRSGLGSYVNRLDKLLYNEDYQNDKGLGIDISVFDDIQDMEQWMISCHEKTKSIKYYASYCWEWKSRYNENAIDIEIPKNNPVFLKKWNPWENQFDWYKDSLDRVGCIYIAQGLGFDYVGFIWWDDLVWRNDHWEFNFDLITPYDSQLKKSLNGSGNYDYLLLNIYRVMLTRAKKGLGIWFKDNETKQHFKEICMMED